MGRSGTVTERLNVPDPAEKTITLPARPSSAAEARDFVRSLLRVSRNHELEDAALLCVTELVANVSLHTDSPTCVVKVIDADDELLIEVLDQASDAPVLSDTPPGAEHGRGLHIIDALVDEWGVRQFPHDGKSIWLKLAPR
jgi:anti-sigma regulatory factor (Ser/Thr protein kinase)